MATKKTTTTKTSTTAKKAAAAPPATPPPAPPAANSPVVASPQPAPQASAPITGVANGSNIGTKVELQTSYQAFIGGLQAYYQADDTFDLPNGLMTRDEVITELQKFITAAEATKASNKVWRADVQAERAVELEVAPVKRGVRNIVTAKFGEDGAELLQFGLEPRKPPKKSAETKAEAVVKMRATRQARGTMGKDQKKDIHGTVPAAPAAGDAVSAGAPAATPTPGPSKS